MTWLGPTPRVIVDDPKLVREILANKFGHFRKRKHNGLVKRLANGLVSHDGDKWAAHRKIINPAFHMEKLKVNLVRACFFVPNVHANFLKLDALLFCRKCCRLSQHAQTSW